MILAWLRRLILTTALCFALAMQTADRTPPALRSGPPIIYQIDRLPVYFRRKPMKKHHAPFDLFA